MLTWNTFFENAVSASNHQKGHDFELLTANVLRFHPLYASVVETVWLLRNGVPSDLKKKLNLPSNDEGIDIVAQTYSGEYWAIQCKFKASKEPPTMRELSTFNNLAHTHCKHISLALLFHTGERGVRKKHLMGDKYAEVGLEFWMGLSQEEWNEITPDRKKRIKPVSRKPREHQIKAIKSAEDHFIKGNASRGRLIMPCGTGKSLTAFWIANSLNIKSVIVAVPSLNLIKQSLQDWTAEFIAQNEHPRPEWQVICSDESTSKIEDDFVSDVYSLGIPTTTNIDDIKAFLNRKSDGRKIIFTTYQSSDRLAQAAKALKYSFDLAILDEAHKTVGIKSKSFATLLSDDNIMIQKRMFMTATERVLKGTNDDVLSMDDETVYGKRFYQLTFKEAIHSTPQIISDYKILTIAVTNSQIKELIQKNKLISDGKNKIEEDEAQSLAAAIALRQATQKYGIKHAISFHRSIKAAENFTNLNIRLNSSKVDKVDLSSYHISSKKSAGQRSQLLDDFKNDKLALMTNAKCLTEGVNVPAIDCVLFADPKQSVVDIVQAAGRALRVNEGKQYGYIMMPLIVPDDTPLEEFTETTPFKQVARIVTALSTQDERIVEEFRLKSEGKKLSTGRIEISGNFPLGMNLDIAAFTSSIESKYWERVGQINWRNVEDARSFVHQFKFKSEQEWRVFCKSQMKPKDLPSVPAKIYENNGWLGMGDWLGTGFVATRERVYRSYEEAKKFVHALNLKSGDEWKLYCDSGKKPTDIPVKPHKTYKYKGWISMGEWLGTGRISNVNKNKRYYLFEDARKFVHNLKLYSYYDWLEFSKSEQRPKYIPAHPERAYKNEGWISFNDWIGSHSKRRINNKYLQYCEAKKYVHNLFIKSSSEWKKFTLSNEFPNNLPKDPYKVYEDSWESWGDWLGTGRVAPQNVKYLTYKEASEYVHLLKLNSFSEWKKFTKMKNFPTNIPKDPKKKYQNEGWRGWGDWLGTYKPSKFEKKYLEFNEAKKRVQPLGLKKTDEWFEFMKSINAFKDVPTYPNKVYADKGWSNWGDWLGTNKLANFNRDFSEYNDAKLFSISLKLNSVKEWMNYCKSNKLPDNIPTNPQRTYKNKGWIGWDEWLGTNRKATNKILLYSLIEAKRILKVNGIKNRVGYNQFRKNFQSDMQFPSIPERTYKDSGWISWDDFLGQK